VHSKYQLSSKKKGHYNKLRMLSIVYMELHVISRRSYYENLMFEVLQLRMIEFQRKAPVTYYYDGVVLGLILYDNA
jgi:hypothetical protein